MRLTTERLYKAGFTLTDCPDGRFWVIEKPPGVEANRIAGICQIYLEDLDTPEVSEELVLQCDSDFKDPVLYLDGFIWQLPQRIFSRIITRITKLK